MMSPSLRSSVPTVAPVLVIPAAVHFRTAFRRRAGFSLTELLVVIGIIALLTGLLMVALRGVGIKAKQTQTESTMRQVLNACTAFQGENGRLPGVIPENLLNANQQITSTENVLLDLLGGFRVLGPTDLTGSAADIDYQNFKTQATATSSMVEMTWPVAGGQWSLVVDTRKIGEGPIVNGKPRAPYFTPGASELVKASYPPATNNANDPTTLIPDLIDAWGQPILFIKQLRERGPLVALANNNPAPQFLRGGIVPYIQSTSLGELAKDQTALSILMTAPDVQSTLGRTLAHASIDNQARGTLCLISAGPDGVFFSRIDGPGNETTPVDDIISAGPNSNIKVVDDYDDIRVFGGA